jgi:hypothetical protein
MVGSRNDDGRRRGLDRVWEENEDDECEGKEGKKCRHWDKAGGEGRVGMFSGCLRRTGWTGIWSTAGMVDSEAEQKKWTGVG